VRFLGASCPAILFEVVHPFHSKHLENRSAAGFLIRNSTVSSPILPFLGRNAVSREPDDFLR
jgi:hypothetical protein